jgi:GntR family transcriptional regulator, transcriptional repressor for pyruvate dehydrogenase complex
MLDALPKRKIRDVVADHLTTFITSERLKPGDRLPTETALAEQLGVSRLSLREATKALEFLGIVAAKPGVGLTVGSVDLDRVTSYLGFHPGLQEAPAVQLIETRILIETGVLPYVMRRMKEDPAVYQGLATIVDALRRERDLARWVELDIAFHRRLVESSGLSPLLPFNDLLAVFFLRFRESVKRAEWKNAIEGHQRLIDQLASGDLAAACKEMEEHIRSHQQRMEIA